MSNELPPLPEPFGWVMSGDCLTRSAELKRSWDAVGIKNIPVYATPPSAPSAAQGATQSNQVSGNSGELDLMAAPGAMAQAERLRDALRRTPQMPVYVYGKEIRAVLDALAASSAQEALQDAGKRASVTNTVADARGWISVDERLPAMSEARPMDPTRPPPVRTPVIVATDAGRVFQTIYSGFGWANLNFGRENVTHWMPLPEPPTAVRSKA